MNVINLNNFVDGDATISVITWSDQMLSKLRKTTLWAGQFRFSSTKTTYPAVTENVGSITLAWNDNTASTFHNVWLRDNCQCPKCLHPSTKQKLHSSGDISLDSKPFAAQIEEGELEVIWSDTADHHKSKFKLDWLRDNDYSAEATQLRLLQDHPTVVWDKKLIEPLANDTDPSSTQSLWKSFKDLTDTRSDKHLADTVFNLQKYGVAFISDVPDQLTAVESIASRFGPIRESFYGRSWDVKSEVDAKNIAYTSLFLDLHMDLMYFESPPGLQFLHCLDCSVGGGESIFMDSFKAVELLRRYHPQDFDILTKVPVTFHYDNNGHHLRFRRPTIFHDDINHNVKVYYAPPFMGRLEAPHNMVEKFYAAFHNFEKILKDPNMIYQYKLRPGDCAIFANRRVLHGRQSFDATSGRRHLRGTYVDWDVLMDRYRVLKKLF